MVVDSNDSSLQEISETKQDEELIQEVEVEMIEDANFEEVSLPEVQVELGGDDLAIADPVANDEVKYPLVDDSDVVKDEVDG